MLLICLEKRTPLQSLWSSNQLKLGEGFVHATQAKVHYAQEVVKSDFAEPGDEDVFRKIQSDFKNASINISDSEIREQMSFLFERAKKEFL